MKCHLIESKQLGLSLDPPPPILFFHPTTSKEFSRPTDDDHSAVLSQRGVNVPSQAVLPQWIRRAASFSMVLPAGCHQAISRRPSVVGIATGRWDASIGLFWLSNLHLHRCASWWSETTFVFAHRHFQKPEESTTFDDDDDGSWVSSKLCLPFLALSQRSEPWKRSNCTSTHMALEWKMLEHFTGCHRDPIRGER